VSSVFLEGPSSSTSYFDFEGPVVEVLDPTTEVICGIVADWAEE